MKSKIKIGRACAQFCAIFLMGSSWQIEAQAANLSFFNNMKADPAKKHVHFMHLDGFRSDLFQKLLEGGQLPHFEFLLNRGKISYVASTVDKSETMKVIESYLTSQRDTSVTGWWEFNRDTIGFKNYWMDPIEVLNYELGMTFPVSPTIFDFLSSQDRTILAGFSLHRRSVPFQNYSRNFAEGLAAVSDHSHYKQAHASMTKILDLFKRMAENPHESLPALSTSLMAAADEMAHLKGVTQDQSHPQSHSHQSSVHQQGATSAPDYCVDRKSSEEREHDPYEEVFRMLDQAKKDPLEMGTILSPGHFTQVTEKSVGHFVWAHSEAAQFCFKIPKIEVFKQSVGMGATLAPELLAASPEYVLGMITTDIELGRLINTLRMIRHRCPEGQGKCFVPGAAHGIAQYIEAGRPEGSLFENTLFVFSGDHGMADTRNLMAKSTPELEATGRSPLSFDLTLIDALNTLMELKTPDAQTLTSEGSEIGMDDTQVAPEIVSFHSFCDRHPGKMAQKCRDAKEWATAFFHELVKDIVHHKASAMGWLGSVAEPLIQGWVEKHVSPFKDQAVTVLSRLYLKGDQEYSEYEKRARAAFMDEHVRVVYGGGARNNAEIFIPKRNESQEHQEEQFQRTSPYTWSERPSFAEILTYQGGRTSKVALVEALKSLPSVGLIYIRKNNALISRDLPLPEEMEIVVLDRQDNEGLIRVKKDSKSGELLYSYESTTEKDPLMYGAFGKGPGIFRTYNEWNDLSVIHRHYYHNAVAGVASYLYSNNPAIGDVTVMRSQGWNFGDNAGGHGGVHREEKLTVMMVSGPGIAPGELMARSVEKAGVTYPTVVDIAPTILSWLGYGEDALPRFAKNGFQEHLEKWLQGERKNILGEVIALGNEMMTQSFPDVKLDLNLHREKLSRLFQFMQHQNPQLPDLSKARQDGNVLILER